MLKVYKWKKARLKWFLLLVSLHLRLIRVAAQFSHSIKLMASTLRKKIPPFFGVEPSVDKCVHIACRPMWILEYSSDGAVMRPQSTRQSAAFLTTIACWYKKKNNIINHLLMWIFHAHVLLNKWWSFYGIHCKKKEAPNRCRGMKNVFYSTHGKQEKTAQRHINCVDRCRLALNDFYLAPFRFYLMAGTKLIKYTLKIN